MKLIQLAGTILDVKVSAEDYAHLRNYPNPWRLHSEGYARTWVDNHYVYMHRVILERMGQLIDDLQADHISGDRLDNQRENLRAVTPQQNRRNRTAPPTGEIPYRGVARVSGSVNFRSYITENERQLYLGVYPTAEMAAHAVNVAMVKRWGADAVTFLNDVPVVVLQPVARVLSSSGLRGVKRHHNKWIARAKVKGKEHHIGSYATTEEAVEARQVWLKNFKI